MAEAVTLEFVWVNVGKLVFSVQQPTFHPTKSAHPTTHKRPFHPATHPSTCPPTTHQPNNSPTHHPSSTTRPAPATCHLSPTTHHTQHFNVSWKALGSGLRTCLFVSWCVGMLVVCGACLASFWVEGIAWLSLSSLVAPRPSPVPCRSCASAGQGHGRAEQGQGQARPGVAGGTDF